MKYLFILGRNVELSVKEILYYFEARNIKINSYSIVENGLLVDLDIKIKERDIDNFGGVISIGEVLAEGKYDSLDKKIDNILVYSEKNNKFNYVVWGFCDEEFYYGIGEYLRKRFKQEKLKSSEKPLTGKMEKQGGGDIYIVGSKINEQYFLFQENEEFYFGKIKYEYDSVSQEKRDMGKPVRREELAISPRISKIMINLSGVKEGGIMLDPFCGVGVILYEGLLKGINVLGIDRDKNAVEGARINLSWGKFDSKDYNLFIGNSRNFKLGKKVDAIVCEPDFGDILRRVPTDAKAKESVLEFENLIVDVINNFKNDVNGKIVFSAPTIRLFSKKRKKCNIDSICERTGLRVLEGFPIDDYRKDQIVGRQIIVLER